MNKGLLLKHVKFPENREIAKQLHRGDRSIIAGYAGLSVSTINDMLSGYRRITDKAAKAIIKRVKEHGELSKSLNEIASQGNGNL